METAISRRARQHGMTQDKPPLSRLASTSCGSGTLRSLNISSSVGSDREETTGFESKKAGPPVVPPCPRGDAERRATIPLLRFPTPSQGGDGGAWICPHVGAGHPRTAVELHRS